LKGKNGEAYTIANKTTAITIRETAEIVVQKIAENSIKLVFNLNLPTEYAPDFNLNLNTTKLESLGWKAEVGLEQSYRRMIKSLETRKNHEF
jgi:dTDP-glucose 4,6-dehydratase